MSQTENTEAFVQYLTEHQNRLYGYVYSLLGDHSRAADVLQETNLVLWRKLDDYRMDSPFLPWAFGIARFQVLAHLRDAKRDRLLLDAELAETLSANVEQQLTRLQDAGIELAHCLKELSGDNRQLIELRYFRAQPIACIAEQLDRSASAVKVALLRVRRQLAGCLEKRVAMED